LTRKSFVQISACKCTKIGWCTILSASAIFGHTKFSWYIQANCTCGGAPVDVVPHVGLAAARSILRWDIGVRTDPNPYNTVCEKWPFRLVDEAGTWWRTSRWPCRQHTPSGHRGSYCTKSLQHRVWKVALFERHDWMTPTSIESHLVTVRRGHFSRIDVTETWTNFALNFRNVPALWLSNE
jgi:hypothetical protein